MMSSGGLQAHGHHGIIKSPNNRAGIKVVHNTHSEGRHFEGGPPPKTCPAPGYNIKTAIPYNFPATVIWSC